MIHLSWMGTSLISDAVTNKDYTEYLKYTSKVYQSHYDNQKLLELHEPFISKNIKLKEWMVGDFILRVA